MAVKFTQLPAAGALDGDEIAALVKNGVSVQSPVSAFATLALFSPEASLVAAAGNNNNINIGTARILVVDTSLGAAALTGFQLGGTGRPLLIVNDGANDLTLPAEDANSTAENRIYGLAAFIVPAGAAQMLIYSDTLLRWVIV